MRNWLKEKRENAELSQEKLGKMIGTTQQAIQHYESGIRDPKPNKAKKIAKILEFDWKLFYEEVS